MEKFFWIPFEDVNDEEATITQLLYESGDYVEKNSIIYSYETTKTAVDVESGEIEGYIFYFIDEGQAAKIGANICVITSDKDYKIQTQEIQSLDSGKNQDYRLTAKAKLLIEEKKIDVKKLNLKGIIREKDINNFIKSKSTITKSDKEKIKYLDRGDTFIEFLLNDDNFRQLSSEEKIRKYRDNGHTIGENVTIMDGAVIIGNTITIEDNVQIGTNTYIEVPEIVIRKNVSIGSNCDIVASQINIGEFSRILNNVLVDIAGGRYFDSNFVCGRDCLIASDVFINACREVRLGDHVSLSHRSIVFTHSFWQSVLEGYSANFGPVKFEDNSQLGSGAQVLPNITVGEGSVIMSNSLVTSPVAKHVLVGGVPAKIIRKDIKKSLSIGQKLRIIQRVFDEFADYLHTDGYSIDKLGDLEIETTKDSVRRNILIVDSLKKLSIKKDIVIVFKKEKNINEKATEVFIVDDKSYLGNLSELGRMLLGFFRRRGILFYPGE